MKPPPSPRGSLPFWLCCRKVVLATTVNGAVYVVDCGICKQKLFNPKTRVLLAGHDRLTGLSQAARGQVLPTVHGIIL